MNNHYETVFVNNKEHDYDATVNLMDDEIRESLHSSLAPCEAQAFVDAYCIAHKEKYDEIFIVN